MCTPRKQVRAEEAMSLRHDCGQPRDLHVQWADEGEAQVALRQIGSALMSDYEDDSNEGDDEAWPLPPRKISRPYPPLLQQALATSPAEERLDWLSIHRDDDSSVEEELERREAARSCTSESTCSWASYSSSDNTEMTYSREGFEDSQPAATMLKDGRQFAGDDALKAAPMHASSRLLSSGSKSHSFRRQACEDLAPPLSPVMETGHANINSRAPQGFMSQLERRPSSSPRSLSQESASTTASPYREGRGSLYSPRCASARSDLSPSPVAVFRPKNGSNSYTCTPSSRNFLHSSTAVHEPRARCGCRGLTVRIDSGPLGLSLEASYRMQQGFMLNQAWSDCAMDKSMFTHSVHVQNLPGKRGNGHVGALDLGLEGRSLSSGLIKVRKVGVEGVGGGTTTFETSNNGSVLVGPPSPLRPGIMSKEARSGVLVGVLEVEEGDILVRVDDVQVTKKSFTEVVTLLDQAKRPTRLTFVRHACGRRFIGRERGGAGGCFCASSAAGRRRPSRGSVYGIGFAGCCGNWGMPRCRCEQPKRSSAIGQTASSPSPQKQNTGYRKTEAEADGCPVAVLLRARCQLRSGGIGEWHEVVASRGRLWQRLLRTMSVDSQSDRAKLRKLTGGSRSLDDYPIPGITGISKRKLTSNYQRLIGNRKSARNGGDSGEAGRALAARVWKDVHRTMSPRRPGGRPGFFSASPCGGGGHVCPAHFAGGSQHAVFRVAYATASTVQFVSGMSYMAALMLVREPVEAIAYATLVTLLQERMMQSLFPLGDVDLLDAYHLSGGRVVTFRASGAARSPSPRRGASAGGGGDIQYPYGGHGYRCNERGEPSFGDYGASEVSSGVNEEAAVYGDGGADEVHGREIAEQEEELIQQVVVGEMLPRLVRAFGKALRRRLPALHNHLCEQAIPMSFLCAEWFTTAYARNTPLPLALCAFDLILVGFDDVMLRLGLAILEVLAPTLKKLNGVEILLQYGGLTANVCFYEVLRCALATQPRQPPLMPAPTPKIHFRSAKRSADSCAIS